MQPVPEHRETAEVVGDILLAYIAATFAALTIIAPGVLAALL
jgi:hypothetical protein